jgi:hypothetical protein
MEQEGMDAFTNRKGVKAHCMVSHLRRGLGGRRRLRRHLRLLAHYRRQLALAHLHTRPKKKSSEESIHYL